MIFKYIINAIVISFLSQKIASSHFLLKKKGNYFKNINCVLLFELFIALILIIINIFFNNIFKDNIYTISLIFTSIFFYLFSIACYYVHEFRGTNLNFQDLLSINTAKEVAGGYKYKILPRFIIIFIVYIAYICANVIFKIDLFNANLLSNISIYRQIFLLFILSDLYLYVVISKESYNYGLFAGEKEGYIYNFFSSIKYFHKNERTAYDINLYNKYLNEKKQYNENIFAKDIKEDDKPHVICIMNESFGLSHKLIKTNIEVTPNYDNLKNAIKGNMYVNTIGGGTCNTEYDFLTYSNVGDFSYPIYPFNNLVKNDIYALPRYFKNIGYKTTAFHPYTKTNYNRDKVYKRFGFDEFLGIEDMKDKRYIRNFISDECMYEEVLNRLDYSIKNGEKLFFYGVSIQNHGGYNQFEGEEVKSIDERFKYDETINSYLSLMKKSDDALGKLIDNIKNKKERVVLLFFGDHNATYDTYINRMIYGEDDEYEMKNAYKVPFLIYDNKNKYNDYIEYMSPNFLATYMIKKIGLPLDYDMCYIDNIYKNIECMNYYRMKKRNDDKLYKIESITYKILQRLFVLENKSRL